MDRGRRGHHGFGRDAQDLLHVRRPRPRSRRLVKFASHYAYAVTIFLMVAGLFIVIARGNLVKKLIGLGIFQTSVYLLYVAPGKLIGGTAPILDPAFKVYSNPLPHVLILTAIVVGVATLALGLALVVRIRESYGTIEEDEILAADLAAGGREE
nr:cation:proton antiporter subunit C [Ramlibacter lithotrophicus]